jgi:hypothetical protein
VNFKTPDISTSTKLYKSVSQHVEAVLGGRMLVLDPSIGSDSSQPGYAIREAGQLTDSGVIDMPRYEDRSRRLWYLRQTLQQQFTEKFDVVVIEDIPTHRFSRGRGGRVFANAKAQIPLHKAVAVIESCFSCPVIFIAPVTWHSFAPLDYIKSDESDAIVMSHAVVEVAKHVKQRAEGKRVRGKRKGA